MTLNPTHGSGEYPNANCPIHEAALDEIKKIVLETRSEVQSLKEIGGPIVNLDKRIDKIDGKTDRLHERVDDVVSDVAVVQRDVNDAKNEQNKLIVKVGLILTPVAAAIGGAIASVVR